MNSVKYIGVFGRVNSGKSSLINMIAKQEISIVSAMPGTTTDPVRKRMEIPNIGVSVLIDTAGIDDSSILGKERVRSTEKVIEQIDIALILYTNNNFSDYESNLLKKISSYKIPTVLVHSQSDIVPLDRNRALSITATTGIDIIEYSSCLLDQREQDSVNDLLISFIAKGLSSSTTREMGIFDGLVTAGDIVLLVCPIDQGAPVGRLILPQIRAIRELLDKNAIPIALQPESLPSFLDSSKISIKFVVTDSQVFSNVAKMIPKEMPLTGFSMLLARSKGDFDLYMQGTPTIDLLKDGERVLILESCSHHSSCEDIGRVKLPKLLQSKSGKQIKCDVIAGFDDIPKDIKKYSLVIQCGGCMITKRQLSSRLKPAIESGIPVTNYGMALAYCMGEYDRAIWISKI